MPRVYIDDKCNFRKCGHNAIVSYWDGSRRLHECSNHIGYHRKLRLLNDLRMGR